MKILAERTHISFEIEEIGVDKLSHYARLPLYRELKWQNSQSLSEKRTVLKESSFFWRIHMEQFPELR